MNRQLDNLPTEEAIQLLKKWSASLGPRPPIAMMSSDVAEGEVNIHCSCNVLGLGMSDSELVCSGVDVEGVTTVLPKPFGTTDVAKVATGCHKLFLTRYAITAAAIHVEQSIILPKTAWPRRCVHKSPWFWP